MTSPLLPTFARVDLQFEQGQGVWLATRDGERYLDFGSGIAVNSLGHAHPHLVEALTRQAGKLWHTSNLFRIPEGERLAQRLVDNSFADQVFYTNSGAEALECAIKMARKYHAVNGQPGRYRIITFEGAFHGRTLATIAAGGQAKYLEGFGPKVDGFDQVRVDDAEALKAAIGPATAAILIEPVQGEGGVRVVPPAKLRELRQLCDEHGLLLILDEVQTGVGRTGKLFAHEWSGITPDIMAIAKGIGGGFPLGAILAREKVAQSLKPGTHGSTFGGNPLACAAGNAVLDVVLAPGFLERVDRVARHLWHGLQTLAQRHPQVVEGVQGAGLLLGLKLRPDVANGDMQSATVAEGLLTVAAGMNVLRLAPPLIITEAEADEAVRLLDRACLRMAPSSAKAAAQ